MDVVKEDMEKVGVTEGMFKVRWSQIISHHYANP